jgi:tRNA A37 threonylcarbamoyladenosine dehydratase
MSNNPIFQRLKIVTGDITLDALNSTEVIVFGIGGVGSWTAESLVRSGIHRITIVDSDVVCITNVNRQLMATTKNVGKSKVEELKARLLDINPRAEVTAIHKAYDLDTRDSFKLGSYDYVIDAIDSYTQKVDLIRNACASGATLFSSMGAGNKVDPTQIKKDSIWKSNRCALSRIIRKGLRRRGFEGDFDVVYSQEVLEPVEHRSTHDGSHKCFCPSVIEDEETGQNLAQDWCHNKVQINGSLAHITSIFGQFLAGMVIMDVMKKVEEMKQAQ